MDETSQPIELLLSVNRDSPRTLGAQIEEQLRAAIRSGTLGAGTRVASTRDLARQLGVSRRVVVDAYAQLGAEGYLVLRQGARPRVAPGPALAERNTAEPARVSASPPRFDFRPSMPDVSTFPRLGWQRSLRHAVATVTDAELGYGDPRGEEVLRTALAHYLGRVRGVATTPTRVVVTSGYWQGLGLVCRALAAGGARRIAVEEPSHPEPRMIAARAGLEPVPVPVDDAGLRIDELERADTQAVLLTPAHQDPTGAVLTGERRAALLAWLQAHDATAIEDDYDAEYRYDRPPVRALQGLAPDRIVYAGSVSKTLAPALRLGWLSVPPRLLEAVTTEKLLADQGTARIEQHAFADFLERGELDRHLRRMRSRYRARRQVLLAALAELLPEASVHGVDAGLHATVRLPGTDDEQAILDEAGRRRIALATLDRYRTSPGSGAPTLLLGYGQITEPAIRPGILELLAAIHTTRSPRP